jgi:hypothetical protein
MKLSTHTSYRISEIVEIHLNSLICYHSANRDNSIGKVNKVKGKMHPCTGIEALYRPYGKMHPCTDTEALYRPYGKVHPCTGFEALYRPYVKMHPCSGTEAL